MNSKGFYKRRRGILDHLESGTIDLLDLGLHDYLCLTADYRTGVCFCSSRKISALCGANERTIRRRLARLERLGWIKTWKSRGERGNYPVLVNKFVVHDASGQEWIVNGEETRDWRNPRLEKLGDHVHDVSTSCPPSDREMATTQEVRSEIKEVKRKTTSKPSGFDGAPSTASGRKSQKSPIFRRCLDYAFESFQARCGQKPTWVEKDFKGLGRIFRAHPDLTIDEFCGRWDRYIADEDSFVAKQGYSLAFFCSKFDRYIVRPSNGSGSLTLGELERMTGGKEDAGHNSEGAGRREGSIGRDVRTGVF